MFKIKNFLLCFSLLVLFSCDDISKMSDQLDKMKDMQSQILAQQNTMLKSLTSLDKKVAGINTASKPPSNNKNNNKRKTPNPNFVHNIDVGNSVVLGNPDAKVTVTKFTDFQ